MRIIGGELGGRVVKDKPSLPARPTTDRAREALFNIITQEFDLEGKRVLDLFSGTGLVALEFLSRGVQHVDAVEIHKESTLYIRRNAGALEVASRLRVIKDDAFRFIVNGYEKYHIIFADPPYDHKALPDLPDTILLNDLLLPDGWLIVEHRSSTELNNKKNLVDQRKYGDSSFSIFEAA